MAQADHDNLEAAFHQLATRLHALEQQNHALLHVHRSTVKPNKPATFDGSNTRNTDTWLFELDMYFAATNTVDPQCVPIVVTFLKDAALQWWQADVKQRQQNQLPPLGTWDQFKVAFRARFLPIEASRTARTLLQTIRQHKSVQDYCARFMKQLALISDMAEADKVEYFTRGLQPMIMKEVVLKNPMTLDEAMHMATRFDLLLSSRNIRLGQPFYRPFNYHNGHAANGYRSSGTTPSSTSSTSQPMELGNMEENVTQADAIDFAPNTNSDIPSASDEFHAFQSNFPKANYNRVPNISREEFQRCRRLGLCLRCKQSGHVARNCPTTASQSRTGSGYPKGAAQRK
ncbi:MAG: hypothetical protein JWR45_3870 [Blastococcus sp.]|nr:hypothetical protein [Blastococcus sp.]